MVPVGFGPVYAGAALRGAFPMIFQVEKKKEEKEKEEEEEGGEREGLGACNYPYFLHLKRR